jgi:hypothetical protein
MKDKVLRSVAIFGLFFMLAIVGAKAQSPARGEVNIPFDFVAGKAKLKAGTYTIRRVSERTISVSSKDRKSAVIVNVPLTVDARDSGSTERVVFNRYGDSYFLSEIWLNAERGRQLFTTGEETRVAREFKMLKATPKRVDVAILKN